MPLLRMADSVDAADLPPGMDAYAGYVDGRWPSYNAIRRRFPPPIHVVSITVKGGVARIADVEAGDLTIDEGLAWLDRAVAETTRQLAARLANKSTDTAPLYPPGLYFPASSLAEIVTACKRHFGPSRRSSYVLWAAHWTEHAPTELPPGVDAVQWDNVEPANYDQTLYGPGFFRAQRAS